MNRSIFQPATLLMLIIFALVGCSGGGDAPVLPDSQPDLSPRATDTQASPRQLWGYWQCSLDTSSGEIDAIPARTALLHINAVGPINNSLGLSIAIDGVQSRPAEGYFVLTVGLTHPFAGNPKLTGFDVRGILITTAGLTAGDLPLPGEDDPMILNADGYTRWWNPTEFTTPGLLGYTPGRYGNDPPPLNPLASVINPYKQFADVLEPESDTVSLVLRPLTDPYGRGVFRSGEKNSREYELQFPVGPGGPEVYFNYAIDASWAMPIKDNPTIPTDFPIAANCDEAFILEPEVKSNTLWTVEGSNQGGGELGLEIQCWDWQGWLTGYPDEVGPIRLISPFCDFEDGIVPNIDASTAGFATLTATIEGIPTAQGEIPVWVGVTAPGTSYKQGNADAPEEPVVAYSLIHVEVGQGECEDNESDSCESAWDILPVDSVDGLLCLDVDETDWFGFTIPEGTAADGTIHLSTYGVGDLSLFLYRDCPPSLVDYSTTYGNADEEITLRNLLEGEYYIEVLEVDDGNPAPRPYTLNTNITGLGQECTLDSDNSGDNAEAIALDGVDEETVCLVGDPSDWYTFEIEPDLSAFGFVELFNNDYADNDIYLYSDPDGPAIYKGDNTGTSDEIIDLDILLAGTYYVEVRAMGDSPVGDRPFSLEMNVLTSTVECDDDDGNNVPEEAEPVGLVSETSGTVCFPSDPDWFTFQVSGASVEGNIILDSDDTYDNDLAVFEDPYEPPIYESAKVGTMYEEIEIEDLPEGVYYIRATAALVSPGTNQDYTLAMNLTSESWGPTDLWVHAFIVRDDSGENPAVAEEEVEGDIGWANEFYGIYVDGSVHLDGITYIDNTRWLSLSIRESERMFDQYGLETGVLNVFYVNSFSDMAGAAAYAFMECQFENQDFTTGYVCMSDYAEDPALAHEMGHAVGLLADMYLLDYYTCAQITYCETGPSDIFCLESDAEMGNLMYWPGGTEVEDYWFSDEDLEMSTEPIDSQAENIMYFHTNYPDAFYKP
jgi:hypothetical protein